MPRRRLTAIALAEGQLVYTIEDKPKPGAQALCGVLIVLDADKRRPQRPEPESKPADRD